jgi:hypothetical protein
MKYLTPVLPVYFFLLSSLTAFATNDVLPRNWGGLSRDNYSLTKANFAQPDKAYAPFTFWFWDEPIIPETYPAKPRAMAKKMLEQGMSPGYPHARICADTLLGQKSNPPLLDLPKEQWLSKEWFEAYDAVLDETIKAGGYLGYCDEYMWPVGSAADRVIKKHPDLANSSLQWAVQDVDGGETVKLPAAFVSLAAVRDSTVSEPDFNKPEEVMTLELKDFTSTDFAEHPGKALGQTVRIDKLRLNSVSLYPAVWKQSAKADFTLEARIDGPLGRLVAQREVREQIAPGDWISLDIPETLGVGTLLYVGAKALGKYDANTLGWWGKATRTYTLGEAYANGQTVPISREVRLSYLTAADVLSASWVWLEKNPGTEHAAYFRKPFEIAKSDIVDAEMRITCDDRHTVYLNGNKLGSANTWTRLITYKKEQLLGAGLQSGKNVLAVECVGGGGLDALICELVVDLATGERLKIRTGDAGWRMSSKTQKDDWHKPGFADNSWDTPKVIGSASASPWRLPEARGKYVKANIKSKTLQIIAEDHADMEWTVPGKGEKWRIYTFTKNDGGSVNFINKDLAKAFIAIAHVPYQERYGDKFGKTIIGSFCDTEGNYGNGNGLVWSKDMPEAYRKHGEGRDVKMWLPLMLDEDVEGLYARARCDWYEAFSECYAAFFQGVSDYLAKYGLYYTGHVWEQTLQSEASCVGAYMDIQRAYSMPGMDALGPNTFRPHDYKESFSVAAFEKRRMLCELLGAGGWEHFTTTILKQGINAAIAFGSSHISHHGVFMTRTLKVWTPDWYDENPMFGYFDLWSQFTTRASYINSGGNVVPDVLIVHPQESVWTLLGDAEKIFWSPESGHVSYLDKLYCKEVQEMNRIYSGAMELLTENRIEYLIADTHYLQEIKQDSRLLRRGELAFKTVILPPLVVLDRAFAGKLVAFAKAGGAVYVLGTLPTGSPEAGLNDPAVKALMAELKATDTFYSIGDTFADAIGKKSDGLESRISFVKGAFKMLQTNRRIDGRDFFWLVNNTEADQQSLVRVAGVKGRASIWNCETGDITAIASEDAEGDSALNLCFAPNEAYWLVFDPQQTALKTPAFTRPERTRIAEATGPWKVTAIKEAQPVLEFPVELPKAYLNNGVMHILSDWSSWSEIPKRFSGLLDYTTTITLEDISEDMQLDLGHVDHIAQVWINDKPIGAKIWSPFTFNTEAFKKGKNTIRIRVGNLVNNNYQDYNAADMALASGLKGPVTVWKTSRRDTLARPKLQTSAFRPGRNEIRIGVCNLVNNYYGMASTSGLVGPVIVTTIAGSGS